MNECKKTFMQYAPYFVLIVGFGWLTIMFLVGAFLCFTKHWGDGLFIAITTGICIGVGLYAINRMGKGCKPINKLLEENKKYWEKAE